MLADESVTDDSFVESIYSHATLSSTALLIQRLILKSYASQMSLQK
jgi:hypothetical protein